MKKYDVVIAGAGPAGIGAALEAARSGLKTALIERYGCVGGNLTLGYVGPLLGKVCPGTVAEEIEDALRAAGFSEVTGDHHPSKPWITVLARK